ncbi:MAG: hypothetical protein CL764_07025 [Chloroflexi bacterium]|nr:hypothetical protein [Chloroflexota bacterium]|tara:strand:- start:670 stop:1548 length:879 start_codon:yes stop_codon:yes gene_type:complete
MNSAKPEADLHIHTYYSDGVMSPTEIIEYAKRKKLLAISITDHDTVNGIDESIKLASKTNLILIPGIELSTEYKSNEIHILCYFMNHQNKSLKKLLEKLHEERLENAETIIKNLSLQGIKLNWDDIKTKTKKSIGRPHIAREMVKKGYVKTVSEAFENYLNNKEKLNLPSKILNSYDAINIIHESGGISAIAHPHTVIDLEKILPDLSDAGLSGLEINNVRYNQSKKNEFEQLAKNFNFISTGGSDFHTDYSKNKLGDSGVPLKTVEKMMQRAISIHQEKVGWTDQRLLKNG